MKSGVAIWLGAFLVALAAQNKTTQDGIFSDPQASRGEAVYGKSCASCHGPDLDGSGQAPALADADFAREWNDQPLCDLFERIRATMPGYAPGTLKPAEVADVLAFMLKRGNHPAGASELSADAAALKRVTFSARTRAPM